MNFKAGSLPSTSSMFRSSAPTKSKRRPRRIAHNSRRVEESPMEGDRISRDPMKTRYAWLARTAVIALVAAATVLRSAEGNSPTDRDRIPAAARKEIKSVVLEIDRIETEALNRARSATLDRFQQITLLGKVIFYDQELSVMRNESCSFCHMPATGFTGPVSALN